MAEENQEVQYTEVEQRAMSEGWVPQDEWAGEPEQWRPAKEFLDRGELFKKIEEQKRELKTLRQDIEHLGKHHAEVKAAAYKEALAELRKEKKVALENGDADAVIEIDERIAETREAQKEADKQPVMKEPEVQPNPKFVAWQARNAWYGTDRAMKAVADEVAREQVAKGNTDPEALLAAVDREIRKEFPHKFENPKRSSASAVEGSTAKARSHTKDSIEDGMSDLEKHIMKRIMFTTGMTKEKYLEEYKAKKSA